MSRGVGRLQCRILAAIRDSDPDVAMTPGHLLRCVHGDCPSPAEAANFHKALGSLGRRGLVERVEPAEVEHAGGTDHHNGRILGSRSLGRGEVRPGQPEADGQESPENHGSWLREGRDRPAAAKLRRQLNLCHVAPNGSGLKRFIPRSSVSTSPRRSVECA